MSFIEAQTLMSQRKGSLAKLPSEILTLIAVQVDTSSVIALSHTCRSLRHDINDTVLSSTLKAQEYDNDKVWQIPPAFYIHHRDARSVLMRYAFADVCAKKLYNACKAESSDPTQGLPDLRKWLPMLLMVGREYSIARTAPVEA